MGRNVGLVLSLFGDELWVKEMCIGSKLMKEELWWLYNVSAYLG